ncbi:hypothetical protein J2851_004373 [Azospirillum rugosum]|uniref:Uncharacterized protein n=1 Tax=Azospirillum rugosum TaxID=416170 RepID=A0ABS4SPU9_9PROT|nr:hypothetical protein [Azospirillum rugosum]
MVSTPTTASATQGLPPGMPVDSYPVHLGDEAA